MENSLANRLGKANRTTYLVLAIGITLSIFGRISVITFIYAKGINIHNQSSFLSWYVWAGAILGTAFLLILELMRTQDKQIKIGFTLLYLCAILTFLDLWFFFSSLLILISNTIVMIILVLSAWRMLFQISQWQKS